MPMGKNHTGTNQILSTIPFYVTLMKIRGKDLKRFWLKMSNDEDEHIVYWEKLLDFTKKGMIPQIIDNPLQVKDEFISIKSKVDKFQKQKNENGDIIENYSIANALIIAYRLEFYMLHPVFEFMFHFLSTISEDISYEEKYDIHIKDLKIDSNRISSEITDEDLFTETLLDYSEPEELRKAIISYEILGKPLSLRNQADNF